jgi:branched-chain amino acid transport system ATP-binding protein
MTTILEARGLMKSFGAVTAANDISASISEHSITGLIGTNGAGKTTFVNMVTGYMKPSGGSIHFAGRDITPLPPRQITRLGIARSFQIPQLYDTLSVRENLIVALGIVSRNAKASIFSKLPSQVPGHNGSIETVAETLMAQFSLSSFADRVARVLPQGVRKQLDIAMAMAGKPQVLLLDEPTSGVAAEEKFGIMDMIMDVVKTEKVTVLFVEHDMDIVSRYADRVLAFYDGRIIADQAPEEAMSNPEVQRYVTGKRHA